MDNQRVKPFVFDDQNYLLDDSRKRLVLFHATGATFAKFSMEYMVSAGGHFGCMEQAGHIAERYPHPRILRVHLKFTKLVAVHFDLGWQWPNQTIHGLFAFGIFDQTDIAVVGWNQQITLPLAHAADIEMIKGCKTSDELVRKCRGPNRQIEALLRSKGIDGIFYPNGNEPKDGKKRDAYLVLNPSQIYSADTGEPLGA